MNGNQARNHGLDLTRTEWVQFLDADDLLQAGKIRSQLDRAARKAEAVVGPLIIRQHDLRGGYQDSPPHPPSNQDLFTQWLRWELAQTGTVLWRTATLRRLGGWNDAYACCQDNELIMRGLQAGIQFELGDGAAAIYRLWSEETVCRKNPRRVILVRTKLMDEMLEWLKQTGLHRTEHDEAASRAGFEMARTLAKSSVKEASRYASSRKAKGLFSIGGDAGPKSFCLLARFMGYANAERVANFLRKPQSNAVAQ